MKTMTCRDMGGMCDTPISGETKEELMGNGMKHVVEAHPDMAASIKSTPMDDPKMVEWSQMFDKKWEETPEA